LESNLALLIQTHCPASLPIRLSPNRYSQCEFRPQALTLTLNSGVTRETKVGVHFLSKIDNIKDSNNIKTNKGEKKLRITGF
jgi:hypothetical protein